MTTEKSDVLEVLNKALCLEQEGREFYQKAAERTVDSKGAAMYRSLADDERMHADMIQRQIDALTSGDEWELPEDVRACTADLDSPLFPRGKVNLEKAVRPDASDMDALLFALKIENDSFALYSEQARSAKDPNVKQMYEYLVEAERTHFNLLMLNYDSLSSSGGFV